MPAQLVGWLVDWSEGEWNLQTQNWEAYLLERKLATEAGYITSVVRPTNVNRELILKYSENALVELGGHSIQQVSSLKISILSNCQIYELETTYNTEIVQRTSFV